MPSPRQDSNIHSGIHLLEDIASHLELPSDLLWQDTPALIARYDVSPFRLWLLFRSVDDNQDGYISKTELIQALSSTTNTQSNSHPQHSDTHRDDSRENDEESKQDGSDNEDSGLEQEISLQEIDALEELYDRVVALDNDSEHDNTDVEQPDNNNDKSCLGISFPQFSRILRYLWLQQLLRSELEPGTHTNSNNQNHNQNHNHKKNRHHVTPDTDSAFECVDYSSVYYRHRTISGHVHHPRTRDFFLAPRHAQARMRWIDVPGSRGSVNSTHLTLLRLSVKLRFHPTSVEDAMDLDEQEPKVRMFEHELLDVGNFNCGTISWLRQAEQYSTRASLTSSRPPNPHNLSTSGTPAIPQPRPSARISSTTSFHSYHRESVTEPVPDFVMAQGEDDDFNNLNEGRHYFITIPMFELSRRSQTSLDLYNDASRLLPLLQLQPLMIEVNEATLGMFVASQPHSNLVVTCSTKWRPTRIRPLSNWNTKPNSVRRRPRKNVWRDNLWNASESSGSLLFGDTSDGPFENDMEDDDMIQSMLGNEKMALERVKELLKKRHSIQRHRNSNWLMHAIIDAVVDNLNPISKIYEAQLRRMATKLFELQHRLSRREVKEMIVMKRDLEWLQHELRPFARVIRHLIDDKNIGSEVTHYLEDVDDHLSRTMEELDSYSSECVSLKDEYNAYLDRRVNDVLFFLTIVTTVVVPAQFFTGYFGMNFEDENGLGDPLLRMGGTGLGIFWLIVAGCTVLTLFIMQRAHFFEKELE